MAKARRKGRHRRQARHLAYRHRGTDGEHDFAQVQVDEHVINVPGCHFFPEKRDFFLESSGARLCHAEPGAAVLL